MAAPVIASVDPATRDLAPARFAALIAGHTEAPLYVAFVHARDDVADDIAPDGIDAEVLNLAARSAPRGLEMAAEQMGASLLVVGSSATGPPGRLSPGSTAQRLLNGTPCPVAVVPREWADAGGLGTVAVGFVDTAEGRAALDAAHALAARAGARLNVLAAVEEEGLRDRAAGAAAAAVGDVVGEPVDIDVQVGDPAEALLACSQEAALLICGARAYGTRPATLLGGVTTRVVAGAACPVIVLAGMAP